jgi:hypothetical protein
VTLEHVPRSTDRAHEPPRPDDPDVHDAEQRVEPNDQDREMHPEGVHRRRVPDEERLIGSEPVEAEQSAEPLAPTLGDTAAEPQAAQP